MFDMGVGHRVKTVGRKRLSHTHTHTHTHTYARRHIMAWFIL